ncbi:alcohol dehydrogenase catalytic domain-containing protein [Pseudonocardia nematodicida]|uniref:Alcohol dehydrogenase catalytic domain-containing protein n=1 Tax=Pseudonocardia nematodicida TaxID=1206997 RepID=A0ABV1KGA1_9PSEU
MSAVTTSMRAGVWADVDRVEIHTVPAPAPAPHEVLLAPTHAGICGSDLAIVGGSHARARPGIVLGHEFAGRVATPATDGTGPDAGRLVAVNPLITCADRGTTPRCDACLGGNDHVCRHLGLFGVDVPGGLAERVAVPAHRLHPVADGVPLAHAALAEPLAVAVHAVARARLTHGDSVLVYGAGPIGLLTALVARARGAEVVTVAEANEWRRSVATGLGLPAVGPDEVLSRSRRATGGVGVDVVFDTAGVPAVAGELSAAARVRGTVMLVAVYKEPTALDLRAVNFAEQTLIGTRVYRDRDFSEAVRLIDGRALPLDGLPVGDFPLDRAQDAFAAARAGTDLVKALISI